MRVFADFGIKAQELEGFFSGPAFLAWQRMGNLQGYAGPLPLSYMKRHAGKPLSFRTCMAGCATCASRPCIVRIAAAVLGCGAPYIHAYLSLIGAVQSCRSASCTACAPLACALCFQRLRALFLLRLWRSTLQRRTPKPPGGGGFRTSSAALTCCIPWIRFSR